MLHTRVPLIASLGCTIVLAASTMPAAAWPTGDGLPVSQRCGEQAQPIVKPTSDGGCYVSWMDNCDGGYDIYLQRYDATGDEQWAHDGVLIADRSFSWTTAYGLAVDADDRAIVAFRDDRFGGERVSAVMVAADGDRPWGDNGVLLGNAGEAAYSPHVAAMTDGDVVVSWSAESDSESSQRLQRIAPDGTILWGNGLSISADGGFVFNADLHPGLNGSVIASWVRQGPNFWDPKHLWAQKFDADGNEQWGHEPLQVYNDGSLQFGYQPLFVPDGLGGAVFWWYSVDPLQCFVQHILTDGTEQFGRNGTAVSTLTSQDRVSPVAAYDAALDMTFVFWVELRQDQALRGIWGQRLDGDGTAVWPAQGIELVAPGTTDVGGIVCFPHDGGAMVAWGQSPGAGQDQIMATLLDTAGGFQWTPSILTVTPTPSDKARLAGAKTAGGSYVLAWMDARSDTNDIYAQSVCADGTMGNCAGAIPASLVSASPAMDQTWWRSAHNIADLTFDRPVDDPPAGSVTVQALLPNGALGPDLSDSFDIYVDGTTLTLEETTPALAHGQWYTVRHQGDWLDVEPFEIHYLCLIGDANNDGRVLPNDLSLINTDIPNLQAGARSRLDINGDARHLPNDLSIAHASIPNLGVDKPSGH